MKGEADDYNTICPECGDKMPDRYYGEPKIMRCPSCEGKYLAKGSIEILRKEIEEL